MNDSKQSLLSYELELYKQLNKDEEEYRNKYSDKVFKSITVIVSIVGAVIWLTSNYFKICKNRAENINNFNILLIILLYVLLCVSTSIFFFILYGYNSRNINPKEIYNLLKDYKSQTNYEDDIIEATNKSLLIAYRKSAINNYKQNKKRSKLFSLFYLLAFIELILLLITFFIEIFL
jgi:hypothetical protein|nr:MAG TPA: hypothetical protein [Caudoviricetes sp.]